MVHFSKAVHALAVGVAVFLVFLGLSLALDACSIKGELVCPDGETTTWESHGPFSASAYCEDPERIKARAEADK